MQDCKPQRILLVPSSFAPNLGGVEEITRNLARCYTTLGHDVIVVVNLYPPDLPRKEVMDGITVHRFDFRYPARSLAAAADFARQAPASFNEFAALLKQFDPTIVHLICASSNCFYVWLAKKLGLIRCPLLTTLQGERFMDDSQLFQVSGFARMAFQNLLSVSDGITACSQYVLDDAKQHFEFGQNRKLEQVIFNGFDPGELRDPQSDFSAQNPGRRFILAAGRVVPSKGFDFLIDAFAKVAAELPDIDLVIVGEGRLREELLEKVTGLGLSNRIRLPGRPSRAQLLALFRECLFFVLPSPLEPFGIVCIEALGAGKTLIATNSGGPPEFIRHQHNGLLVAPSNTEALSNAMKLLAMDKTLRSNLQSNALDNSNIFHWSAISDRYLEAYEELWRQ